MKTYTMKVAESFTEVAEAWNRGESVNYPDTSFQTPIDEQQAIADSIVEGKHTHDDLRELIRTLQAMDDAGAPPAIRAAEALINRMWSTANEKELSPAKRKSLLWSDIHPGRNKQLTEERDLLLRRVVDHLVGSDICEKRPHGWTLENLADPDSPLFGIVSEDAINKVRRRTSNASIAIRDDQQLEIDIYMLKRTQEKLSQASD